MGTHVIEAGFPVNSQAEFEAVRDIAEATRNTTCGLARVVDEDIEAALDSGVDMVHVFVSTSDVQLEDSMHATRAEARERAVEAVRTVKDAGVECMFSPMDATRTDYDYLFDVVEAVTDAGTDWINIPDTCGVATPTRMADLVRRVCEHTTARVDVHTHDDFGMATTWLGLYVLTLLFGLILFTDTLAAAWAASVEGPIRFAHHSVMAGFVAALGLVIGALGASFEGGVYFRHVTFIDEET